MYQLLQGCNIRAFVLAEIGSEGLLVNVLGEKTTAAAGDDFVIARHSLVILAALVELSGNGIEVGNANHINPPKRI
jgi:hypothetical protein